MADPLNVLREIVQDAVAEGLVNEIEEEAANAAFAQLETLVETLEWIATEDARYSTRARRDYKRAAWNALAPFIEAVEHNG